MEAKNSFIIIPDFILSNNKLSANAKILYGRILSLCKQGGVCFAGNKYFKEKHNFGYSTTARLISELVKESLVASETTKFKDGYKRKIRIVRKSNDNPF